MDTLDAQLLRDSAACRLTCFIAVKAEADGLDIGIVPEHLKQHTISHTAAGSVAVAAPAGLIQRDKRQKINRRFKQIQPIVRACPMEAVLRDAAGSISFESGLCPCATKIGVSGDVIGIKADEYCVVVFCRLVDHLPVCEGIDHIPVNAAPAYEVGMENKLNYTQNGDYLIPNLTLSETETKPLGKYGRMRKKYLQENRPVLWNSMILSETLFPHLREIDETANRRLEQMMPELMKRNGVTEELKAKDPMMWTGVMNNLKNQAEETILAELILA